MFIGDGSINIAKNCSDLVLHSGSVNYQDILSCSKTTDTNCYFIAENYTVDTNIKVCKFDFTSTGNISYTQHNSTRIVYSDIATVDAENIIVSGLEIFSNPQQFVFYSTNHSSTSVNWVVIADTFGKYLSLFCPQVACKLVVLILHVF